MVWNGRVITKKRNDESTRKEIGANCNKDFLDKGQGFENYSLV